MTMPVVPYIPYIPLRKQLEEQGWRTPNTYCSRSYGDFDSSPANYLFIILDTETYERAFVGYVGMSLNMEKRMRAHPVRREIDALQVYVQTWFIQTPANQLRAFERACIRRFDPPWNISGKARGVSA
jgi:hypothetical protein